MPELVVKVPMLLRGEVKRLEDEVNELVSMEEKRKLLSMFFDEIMKGARQLTEEEVIKLGRNLKKGRADKLRSMGLV